MMTVRLDKNKHDRHYFDCEVEPLNKLSENCANLSTL